MNKTELTNTLAEMLNLTPRQSDAVINLFFDSMINELRNNGRVEIRGFGNFVVRNYKSYTGRNPKTGEKVSVPEKKLPFWKTGKDLTDRVNNQ